MEKGERKGAGGGEDAKEEGELRKVSSDSVHFQAKALVRREKGKEKRTVTFVSENSEKLTLKTDKRPVKEDIVGGEGEGRKARTNIHSIYSCTSLKSVCPTDDR